MITTIRVQDLVDNSRFGTFQRFILIICFATAVVDGIDNQVIGFSAPAIAAALHIPLSAFGAIFSAGTLGGLIGAASLGTFADRIGRQRSLLICTLLFATLTLATPLARSTSELFALRLLAGLGLGGAMPGFLTLVSEYSPKRHRGFAIGLLWCGYPVGGVVGGLSGSFLLPHFGWKAMFLLGGGLAIVVAAAQWRFLPESLQFLARREDARERVRSLAGRLAPTLDLTQTQFISDVTDPMRSKTSIAEIFTGGRAICTLLLWSALFFTFMITNFFVLWAPALLKTAGLPFSTVALMLALNNFAGVVGQVGSGYLVDKTSPFRVIAIAYGCQAIATGILAVSIHTPPIVGMTMVVIGLLGGPGIAGTLFLATSIYPSHIRSTGVGWATSVGRTGQVVGALIIGALLARGFLPREIFLGMCTPPLIALGCVALLGMAVRRLPASEARVSDGTRAAER
jgi:AAHS family 4-hydroxybenzoate transporter-like MFS transporter